MSSTGVAKLQKSLFSHTFLWDLRLFSVAKEWVQLRQKWPGSLDVIPKNPSPFGIIKRIIFNDDLSYVLIHNIFSFKAYKTFRAIVRFFF